MIKLESFSSFFEIFAGFSLAFGFLDISKIYFDDISDRLKKAIFAMSIQTKQKNRTSRIFLKFVSFVIETLFNPMCSDQKIQRFHLQFGIYNIVIVFLVSFYSSFADIDSNEYFIKNINSLRFIILFVLSSCFSLILHQYNDINRKNKSSFLSQSLTIIPVNFVLSYLLVNYSENRCFALEYIIISTILILLTSLLSKWQKAYTIRIISFLFLCIMGFVACHLPLINLFIEHNRLIVLGIVFSVTTPTAITVMILIVLPFISTSAEKMAKKNP